MENFLCGGLLAMFSFAFGAIMARATDVREMKPSLRNPFKPTRNDPPVTGEEE